MTGLASRQDKESMSASIEVIPVELEDMLCSVALERLLIGVTTFLFIALPIVVCFRSCGIPVVKDFNRRVLAPYRLC